MNQYKLSIITINYNNRDGLRKTIESVVNQTCKDFQYIIIDGGSTDGGVEVIKEYADQIDYWVSESDRGIYHAMNKGIDKAEGEYCIFMNSADFFYDKNVLRNIYPYLDGTGVVAGDIMLENLCRLPEEVTFLTFYTFTLPHQAVFIRTDLQKKRKYDENLKIASDFKFFVETLITDNESYKKVPFIISNMDMTGISSHQGNIAKLEREEVLNTMFSLRILKDYHRIVYGESRIEKRFYAIVVNSGYNKMLYTLNVTIIKIFSLFKRNSSWIKQFPCFLFITTRLKS